jgi:prolyl-tRNA synthetase
MSNEKANKNIKNNKITHSKRLTAKKLEISDWYSQVLFFADIVDDRYDVKGMAVWKPYGYKAIMNLKSIWDKLFQESDIQECYFPLIIPIEYCEQNESWWEGFQNEGYKVVAGSNEKIQGVLRPTGEPAMYPMYSKWIRSKSDLPIRLYETVSSFRYETKHTRPLIRTREINVWHEIHTAHATKEDNDKEFKLHLELWDELWNHLALPIFKVNKPQWECFPGAVGAIEYYTTTPSGKVMENGSVNNLGQAYAKKFNIKYKDETGKDNYVWQLCTGNGARLLGGAFMIHGDDKGLIMPPKIAPIKAIIIPILFKDKEDLVLKYSEEIYNELKVSFDIKLDDRDKSVGEKYYDWEIKGVPVRIEIGPKEAENNQLVLVRRDINEKIIIKKHNLISSLTQTLEQIHQNLLSNATEMLNNQLTYTNTLDEIKQNIKNNKISVIHWCKDKGCYDNICNLGDGIEGFGTDINEDSDGFCLNCNKKTKTKLYLAKSY